VLSSEQGTAIGQDWGQNGEKFQSNYFSKLLLKIKKRQKV
jgi:hypothetical protein